MHEQLTCRLFCRSTLNNTIAVCFCLCLCAAARLCARLCARLFRDRAGPWVHPVHRGMLPQDLQTSPKRSARVHQNSLRSKHAHGGARARTRYGGRKRHGCLLPDCSHLRPHARATCMASSATLLTTLLSTRDVNTSSFSSKAVICTRAHRWLGPLSATAWGANRANAQKRRPRSLQSLALAAFVDFGRAL